jgi:hypothetical protein
VARYCDAKKNSCTRRASSRVVPNASLIESKERLHQAISRFAFFATSRRRVHALRRCDSRSIAVRVR